MFIHREKINQDGTISLVEILDNKELTINNYDAAGKIEIFTDSAIFTIYVEDNKMKISCLKHEDASCHNSYTCSVCKNRKKGG